MKKRLLILIFQEELVNGLSYHHDKILAYENSSSFLVWKKEKCMGRVVTFDSSTCCYLDRLNHWALEVQYEPAKRGDLAMVGRPPL